MSNLRVNDWDRTQLARRKTKRLSDRSAIERMIDDAKRWSAAHASLSAEAMRDMTQDLRQAVCQSRCLLAPESIGTEIVTAAIGLVLTGVRQTMGVDLFDVQLQAGVVVALGGVAEMQTGEGKTFAGILPAYLHSLGGQGVHVVTPNEYLAARDHEQLTPVFHALGVTTGLAAEQADDQQAHAAYRADVTYGASGTFGFDYLRDQIAIQTRLGHEPGHQFLARLRGLARIVTRQRRPAAAIIDEIDDVLLDDAVSPLILSGIDQGEAPDADLHRAARQVADRLRQNIHFVRTSSLGISLTHRGLDRLYEDRRWAAHEKLLRPWHEYVQSALRAKHCYRRDIHYVVDQDCVRIIDDSTGRVFADRSWSGGLHQAVQAREGLMIRPESKTLARTTKQTYFRRYRFLAGMTGTADGCQRELASVYGLPVVQIATRLPTRRELYPTVIANNTDAKWDAVVDEAIAMRQAGRAVLIGTLSIAESHAVSDRLKQMGHPFQLLNGVQDAEEAAIIARAGVSGTITVATNLAGRGTDIRLDERTRRHGGLHVILSQSHALSRVDRQLIGRGARCGDPGSARRFLAATDPLIQENATWIGRAILRQLGANESLMAPGFDREITKVQHGRQREATAKRLQLLQTECDDQTILRQTEHQPDSCWML